MIRKQQQAPKKIAGAFSVSRDGERVAFFSVLGLVVAFYFWTATTNGVYPNNSSAIYYPLLSKSFMEGHLDLPIKPLPELLALSDPYDPILNQNYRLHDTSLYNGRYYIYFGPTPVILIFLPWLLLTGTYFPQYLAVPIFCSAGYILGALLFMAMVRRYFPSTPLWLKIICLLSLGMANVCPFLLRRPDIYEVAIGCAYFLLQLIFYSFYRALQEPARALPWLVLASIAIGASAGARFNYALLGFIFTAAILVMVWQRYVKAGRNRWGLLWALVPVACIGLILMWYNYARFGSPFELGRDYQLTGRMESRHLQRAVQLENIPIGFWFYFLSPPAVSPKFPFIDAIPTIWFHMPTYYYEVEKVTGLFVISPVALLALTLPWLLNKKWETGNAPLLATLVFMTASVSLLTASLLCYGGVTMRYEADFAPTLVLFGCIMLCHFHSLPRKSKIGRWALNGIFAVILLIGLWNGLCLSFTGYYDYLRLGSPETYATLEQIFSPIEIIAKAIVDLF